jgi:hypothetical protein
MAVVTDSFIAQLVLLSVPLAIFMLPTETITVFRNLTMAAHFLPNGGLWVALMDNFIIHEVLL